MTPIERKAEFAKHATLANKAQGRVAEEDLDTSWTHVRECMDEIRKPSDELAKKIADFVGMSVDDFWGDYLATSAS